MAIKVTLSSGITSAKTTSLFQWDYGQQLQIISDDLPPIVEVHFACKGMSEAVVMPCSITDGTGIVTIPDSCLEQSTDITAWVYSIDGTQGKTVKTITIPIVSRIRPGRSETIPQSVTDKYTELISQVNDAISDLKDGTVTVKKAETAEKANKATSATNAGFANTAQKAVQADSAVTATNTTNDSLGRKIVNTYVTEPQEAAYSLLVKTTLAYEGLAGGVLAFLVESVDSDGNAVSNVCFTIDLAKSCHSQMLFLPQSGEMESSLYYIDFARDVDGIYFPTVMRIFHSEDKTGNIQVIISEAGNSFNIYYKRLSRSYPVG